MRSKRKSRLQILYNKQSGRCAYCGDPMIVGSEMSNHPRHVSVDHIIPRSRGGVSSEWNLLAVCRECNCEKGSMSLRDFLMRKFPKDFDKHPEWVHPALMME